MLADSTRDLCSLCDGGACGCRQIYDSGLWMHADVLSWLMHGARLNTQVGGGLQLSKMACRCLLNNDHVTKMAAHTHTQAAGDYL